MSKKSSHPRFARPLITEVLPHELPLIFTNDFLYLSIVERSVDPDDGVFLQQIRSLPSSKSARYTKPYEFSIRKDRGGSTSLGIMHPHSQIAAAKFCDEFAETIIASCNVSQASLRHPTSVARLSAQAPFQSPDKAQAVVHTEAEEDEAELSKIVSFFSYREFNLLGKFYESASFIALEKRFSKLRTLDVTKCFHSIYTHSVSWAVKEKIFAKEFPKLFAFEQQFDLLMQRQNFNETNGIIIGPELSRVFAEVIFQKIDLNVVRSAAEASLMEGRDFELRRYVDDYFVFANTDESLIVIEEILARELQSYKLHLNSSKSNTLPRPFVTPLSSAKRDISRAIYELKDAVDEVRIASDAHKYHVVTRRVKAKTLEARLIIGEHGVGFHNISGWALSLINAMTIELVDSAKTLSTDDIDKASCIERATWSILSLAFYIISLDIRVTTTYALANLVRLLDRKGYKKIRENSDWIEHILLKEIIDLLSLSHDAFYHRMKRVDSVETLNILIIGAHYFKISFCSNAEVTKVVTELLRCPITYFHYVALKFLMLKDANGFSTQLDDLNAKAVAHVVSKKLDLTTDTEAYLMLCDLMSAPDLTHAAKRNLWRQVISKNPPSNDRLDFVAARCGFIDWKGLRMERLLARKKLRPVYE